MVSGAVADGYLVGDLLAVGMTLLMAVMMLIIRQQHETPMLPAACLSALLCPLADVTMTVGIQATVRSRSICHRRSIERL
jgi:hypothetical protein